MRIAYVGQMADVSTENGISKKIAMQAAAWRAGGHDVRYFALAPSARTWSGLAPLPIELIASEAGGSRLARSWRLARRVRAWAPNVIYFRYAYHSPGLPALFRAVPTVAEINSDDRREYPLTLDPFRVWYHRLTRRRVLRPIAGYVTVTHELAQRFAHWDRPVAVIGNGISLRQFPLLPPPPREGPPGLVFLGTAGSPWHGLERVDELARLLPELRFDVIGIDRVAWDRQVPGTSPAANVRLRGHIGRADYEPLLAQATAAVGSLALYKNGMDEACPLKVREYLAHGLPVIAAYRDTDIPGVADYFLRLPNDAQSLGPQRERILAFLEFWRERRVPRGSVAHLDTEVKETERLAFVAQVASGVRFLR